MTVAGHFYDWQSNGRRLKHDQCSPNLIAVRHELQHRWAWLTHLGCFNARPIRGSTTVVSSHTYGAALDLGYPPVMDHAVQGQVAGFLVAWSQEMGIDAIHDYRRSRIWRAGRTPDVSEACDLWWRAQRPNTATGMGQTWANHLHIETHADTWHLATDLPSRGIL